MSSDVSQLPAHHESYLTSATTLGNISEAASLCSTSRIMDMDSLSLSSNLGTTPTSSSSSFKTINTTHYTLPHNIINNKKHAVLAEAEDIDDIEDHVDACGIDAHNLTADDVEYMDNENFVDSLEMFNSKSRLDSYSSTRNRKISETKELMDQIEKVVLLPTEKVSTEAREYWATLDLYNNSKMAFNKRTRSVRLKREKLNSEWLQMSGVNRDESNNPILGVAKQQIPTSVKLMSQQRHDPETCKCVKCSIVYHESLIRGVNDTKSAVCRKCGVKLVACTCCTSSSGSMGSSEEQVSVEKIESGTTGQSNVKKDEFEKKLFDIKNELVNLSETSLDVFQLLLQLSDTMLELNSQLNKNSLLSSRQTSSSQLFFINQLISSNLSLNNQYFDANLPANNTKPQQKAQNRRIEDFLQKTLNSVQSAASNYPINSKYPTLPTNPLLKKTPLDSQTTYPTISHINNNLFNNASNYKDSDHLIENLYDKTSVTQFVDSFFNNNTASSNNNNNSDSSFSMNSRNSGYYSLLSTLNKNSHFTESDFIVDNENPYQCIDDDLMGKVESMVQQAKANEQDKFQVLKNTSNSNSQAESASLNSDALSTSSTQSSLNRSQPVHPNSASNALIHQHRNEPADKHSPKKSSNSTGSSSICSSSNMDLFSLPSTCSSTTNITNNEPTIGTTCNTQLSTNLVLNESQTINRRCLKPNSNYNKATDNFIQSYRLDKSPVISNRDGIKSDTTKKSTIIPELPLASNLLSQNMQNMQYNRNNAKPSAGSIYGSHVLQAAGSTRRKPSFKFDSNILNRVQTMGLEKSIDEANTLELADQVCGVKSYRFNGGGRPVNHQVSLDSGIYLPTENEELTA